ncbi:MAG: hypothetical protein SOX77_03220 [Candidatus Borkfalkiaceae bacterium]|nr:hypothetical protein [Christensenellaceae bacterium]
MNVFEYVSNDKNTMNYLVFYPDDYADLPLICYLHGAGERGNVLSHLYRHGIPKLIAEGIEIPAVIVCPQCPTEFVWDNIVVSVKKLIDEIAVKFKIKSDRICITGSSMGGYGTWMMGQTYSNYFSAIAPVSGGGMTWRVEKLKTTKIYAVHGKLDSVIPCFNTEDMINALKLNNIGAKLLLLEDFGHNDCIDYAYRNTDLIQWLLAQRRTDFTEVAEVCSEFF